MTALARTFLGLGFLGAMLATSCSPPDKGVLDRDVSTRASPASFSAPTGGVSTVIERRCGSLDCHGSTARNLRVYSSRGLRLPNAAGLTPGNGDTTQDEITANFQSLLTLEPELTNKVLEGGDPYSLLILKKPLEIEKHKGGPVIKRNDDAEQCIVSWLRESKETPVNKDACTRAALFPRE